MSTQSKHEKKGLMDYLPTYRFSQPAHLAAASSAIVAMSVYYNRKGSVRLDYPSTALSVTHLLTTGGWFGTQIWVTFVAGLTMFHNLPRHLFGDVQSRLFPKYFSFGVLSNAVCICTYFLHHSINNLETRGFIQISAMGLSLLSNCANLLYFLPATREVALRKNKIEKEYGLDTHVGPVSQTQFDELFQKEPDFKKHYKTFMRYHGYSALLNIVSLVGSVVHLYCLAGNLSSF
ncbi:DgyrCDS5295 [Dimorphilus gyrociliatus]|uniref:DgyrCDS5295 n=1 Tax=Dimorphilus gyrociliatus TaxID=2664684 RepID=A0A7I8VL44_9ANNE|nr:DgyrCDS5295 [Dimorphilus gyrociliatus]